jgi:hypothetical protein
MGINPRQLTYHPGVNWKGNVFLLTALFGAAWLGHYMEKQEGNRQVRYRDQSALFGGRKSPEDEPSWGDKVS